jgi:hypothetical protein
MGIGMQAAEFLNCREVQADIIKHLQTLLIETIERKEAIVAPVASSSDAQLAIHRSYTRDLHSVQVCAYIALLSLTGSE